MSFASLSSLPGTARALELGREQGLHFGGQLYASIRGSIMADAAFGESRPGEPVRSDSRILWLSSCKPVTAVAIAMLWEEGRLGLDETVASYLPAFAAGGKESVTVRHLLTHTGGFRMMEVGWPEKSWQEIVAHVCAARLEPRWAPGEKAGYHRESSWFILGELVQRLSGVSFTTFVRERIFQPLGLTDCGIGLPEADYEQVRPTLVAMWDTATTPPREAHWDRRERVVSPNPASNGIGPIRGLARFYECLLAGGSLAGATLLRPQTVEAMWARQRTGLLDQTFRHVMDWGLGFIPNPAIYGDADAPYAYGPHASRRACGHSGYRTSTAFADPEHGLVVALAVNGAPSDEAHAVRFRTILAAIYEDLGLVATPPATAT